MRWTVLADNRSTDPHRRTEHGLSIFLETERHNILLDTGASDLFVQNADELGVDLCCVDYVFISHGHSDHAGGLPFFLQRNRHAKIIVSADAIKEQFFSKRGGLHNITAQWPAVDDDRLLLIDYTCELVTGIQILAHIPQVHPVPKGNEYLFVQDSHGDLVRDDFRHELALWADGFLFTGCAHSGLENILAACRFDPAGPGAAQSQLWPVHTVAGGFHLLDGNESSEDLTTLAFRLKSTYPNTQFYTSHCTGNQAFGTMKGVLGAALHHLEGSENESLTNFNLVSRFRQP